MKRMGPVNRGEASRLLLGCLVGFFVATLASADRSERRRGPAFDMAPADTHWAFVALEKPSVPTIEGAASPVDAFILRELESRGMRQNAPSDRRSLIRRLSYDLIGLPPTAEEVEAFVADDSPEAYEKVVERLLASPAYGERWARHWLDVARYADTQGVFRGGRNAFGYAYRDYVVESFNEDKPYARFLLEQMVADQIELDEEEDLAALGFLTLGRTFFGRKDYIIDDQIDVVTRGLQGLTVSCARCHDHKSDPIPTADYYSLHGIFNSSRNPEELPVIRYPDDDDEYRSYEDEFARIEAEIEKKANEVIDTFLVEERSLAGVYLSAVDEGRSIEDDEAFVEFAGSKKINADVLRLWVDFLEMPEGRETPALADWFERDADGDVEAGVDAYNRRFELAAKGDESADPVAQAFLELEGSPLNPDREAVRKWIRRRIGGQTGTLQRELEALDWTHPGAPIRAHALVDEERPKNSRIYNRGDKGNLGEEVPRQYLQILNTSGRVSYTEGSGRLQLAKEIVDAANPLTARVFANRVWGWHMGGHLVDTPSDFGVRTSEPVHLDLLNWLAATLIESDWSPKALHRAIVYSETYRQSSELNRKGMAEDPANTLWHSFNKTRLDFESMRDTMLAVSGNLDRTIGGLPVDITDSKTNRRALYAFIDRQDMPGVFRTFDHPSPDVSSPKRLETAVPQQALFMMNNPFVIEQAKQLAARVSEESDVVGRIDRLYRYAFQREPTAAERQDGLAFIEATESLGPYQTNNEPDSAVDEANEILEGGLDSWEQYAQALLQSNELIFLD